MKPEKKRPIWLDFLLLLLLPIAGLSLGVAVTRWLNIDQAAYSDLIINLLFLVFCLIGTAFFRFSRRDVGLQVIREQIGWHVFTSLVIFALYLLFYIIAIRISSLKPMTSTMTWGILTAFVIALAEELYFRGMLYRFIEKHDSALGALVLTALLFGLFHVRQGLTGIVTKAVTGWLWGSVRYYLKYDLYDHLSHPFRLQCPLAGFRRQLEQPAAVGGLWPANGRIPAWPCDRIPESSKNRQWSNR